MQLYVMELYRRFKECGSVSVGLQTLRKGDMFFDLTEGCSSAVDALAAGASCVVVSSASGAAVQGNAGYFQVDDVLTALHDLARWHRSMSFVGGIPIPVIALAGESCLADVKEEIVGALSGRLEVVATPGEADDLRTLPLTLLRITPSTKVVVVAFASGRQGDVAKMSNVALPNYGLVTSASACTGELYSYLRRTSDRVFLNVDDPLLFSMASECGLHHDPERADSLVIPYNDGQAASAIAEAISSVL